MWTVEVRDPSIIPGEINIHYFRSDYILSFADATQPNVMKVRSKFERFAKVHAQGQMALLGNVKMDQAKSKALKKYLGASAKEWMKAVGYVPDPERLASDIANAATEMHLMLQQQQQWGA